MTTRAHQIDTMVCLVGEQPISNLLPILHIQPRRTLLAHTALTESVAKNVHDTLSWRGIVGAEYLCVDPYDIASTRKHLLERVVSTDGTLCFNITGGTKPMMLAACEAANQKDATLCYLQSEGSKSDLHWYSSCSGQLAQSGIDTIPTLLCVESYVRAFGFREFTKNPVSSTMQIPAKIDISQYYERNIVKYLSSCADVDEVWHSLSVKRHISNSQKQVEIDAVIRVGNHVGFIEAKYGRDDLKKAIGQLAIASRSEFFGRYVRRFFVHYIPTLEQGLQELAQAQDIHCLHVGANEQAELNPLDSGTLRSKIMTVMKR